MSTTFSLELPSGLQVTLKGWDLRWANAQVRSSTSAAVMETTLLTECTVGVDDPGPYQLKDGKLNWNDVLICDRSIALLASRIPVWGGMLPIDHPCPRTHPTPCRGKLRLPDADGDGLTALNLEHIVRDEIYPLPDESRRRIHDGDNRFEIEWEGIPITFRLLYGRDQDGLQRFVGGASKEMVTRSLAARMLKFGEHGDGTPNSRVEIADVLKGGGYSYRLIELQNLMDEHDGGFDTTIFLTCNDHNCGWAGEVELPLAGMPSFWRPSTKRKRKTRGELRRSSSEA